MANSTVNITKNTIGGPGPYLFDLPVDGGSHIFEGTLVSQLTATGALTPYSTAATGVCVGVAQHEADNTSGADGDVRCIVEANRMYAFANGTAGDAFADTDLIGALVYATDDHTVAKTSNTEARTPVGFFYGLEDDGKVRVLIDPPLAKVVLALQGSGVVGVNNAFG